MSFLAQLASRCPDVSPCFCWTTVQPDGAKLAQLPMSDTEQKANIGIVVTWHGSSRMIRCLVTVLVVWSSLKCSLDLCHFPRGNEGSRRMQKRGGW